uniref:ATP synthase subunit a n=1 Tax=Paratapes undulatus TaxID=2602928 RepID=H6BHV2_9BIVA|nr:ATP synthase F0 subunit 6 [Paratapes undulatus]AEH99643.1 ATP synthase F0 subunit 6 [Paratapes undulatus]
MMSDLFSVFDYSLGSVNLIECIVPWHGGLLLLFYVCCFMVYFYDLSDLESVVFFLTDAIVVSMPEASKISSVTPHLMVSLFMYLLSVCVMGVFPYSFPLGAHVVISMGLAFPFWFMTFAMNLNVNWRLAWIKSVCQGNSFFTSLIVIASDCLSILIRPITLSARLSLNVLIGSIILKIGSSLALGVLFPVSNSLVLGLFFIVFSVCLLLAEFCVMCLQTMVFYGLMISYLSEVLMKPE